ncbi:MAG: hypothetical protein RML72_05895, partial [Bacteroidia bacterium]|nr:hypothetical protein [Bacteroidia bacterium]
MHSKFPFLYCTNLSFFKLLFCFYWFFLCNEKAKGQSTFTASLPLATSYVFESCPGGTTINFQFTGLAANQRIRLYGQPAPPTSYNSWLPIGLSALTEAAGGSPPIYTAPGAGISFNGFPGGIAHIRAGGGGTFAQSLGPGQPFPTCAPNITNPLFTTSAARRIYVCNNTLHINAATTTIGAAVNKFSLEIPNLYTDGKKFFATRFNLQIETNSINPATFYFAFAHTALGGASHVLRVIDDGVTVGPHNPGGALQFGVAGNNVIISAWDENAYVAILTTNNPTFEIEIYAYNTTNTTEKLLFTRGSSTYTLECGLNNGQYLVFINGMPYRFGLQGNSTLEFGGFGFAAHSGTTDPNQAPQIKITNWFYQLFDVATNDQTNLGGMVHVYTSTSQSANTTNTGIGIGIYTAQQFLEDIPPGIVTVTGFSIPFTGTVYAAVYNTQTHREETPRVPITLILHPTPSKPTLPSIIGRCGGPGLVTFTFQAGASHNGNSLNIPGYVYTTATSPAPGQFTQSPSIGSVNTTAATDYTITLNATGSYNFGVGTNPPIQYVRRTPSA